MRSRTILAAAAVLAAGFAGSHAAEPKQTAAAVTPAKQEDGVRSIELPQLPLTLPEAEGRSLVVANCMICHSPNYIMMQPPLSRKVWEAEVEKMRKTFGAPVPDAVVPQIVEYLVKVRGAETGG